MFYSSNSIHFALCVFPDLPRRFPFCTSTVQCVSGLIYFGRKLHIVAVCLSSIVVDRIALVYVILAATHHLSHPQVQKGMVGMLSERNT